jgi:hypothetical protein
MRQRPGYLGGRDDEGPLKPKTTQNDARPAAVQEAIRSQAAPGASELAKKEAKKDKPLAKADFPPGLVVSEAAKTKMQELQTAAKENAAKKEQKKIAQINKWQARTDVMERWQKNAAKFEAKRTELLAKWDAQDRRKAAHRDEVLARLTQNNAAPAAIEAQKLKMAQEDTVEALSRASELAKVETEELAATEKQEKDQIKRDQRFNAWAGIFGWKKRTILEPS